MTVDSRAFRNALGCFATGVTVVTSTTPEGELLGITASSFNSVSLDPPLVLFSMDRSAYSLKAFEESGCFAINVLRDDQVALSLTFARTLADKWDGVAYEIWETGCPILTEALANFECRTYSIHDGGDHLIFVGRVLRLRSQDEGQPLLYFRGTYHHIG